MATRWTIADMPDQTGKTTVVTGGNGGIGYEAARALAAAGARVVLAVRSEDKGHAAAEAIRRAHPAAAVEVLALDLADLASVRRFAAAFRARYAALALLINNAGVLALPYRRTADGFEMQFGTNHLGHFALTGLLLPAILAAPGARVVTVSSGLHWGGRIAFDNLDGASGYRRWPAYEQSKLANLLFAYELQRRLDAAGADALSVGCHPGLAATDLWTAGARMEGSRLRERLAGMLRGLVAQSREMGALPTLCAATAPGVRGGSYIGPMALFGLRGYPGQARSSARSRDPELARRLWAVSEELTGVRFAALDDAARLAPVAGR
jgi:NAD(P)-dependent dehydrogenase (short-subunit alcohol dehydrogenase family)